ncbi:peptide chain release factor 2 [Hutsoniella sourekii]|uniref:peptide chain release factor 2 n=1 Tax=Hutsoniella sourekii TaxID=87650 RepID=UPI0012EDAB02|nr:peptide chain release factor 2 [Hutsoniella sourekii]
MELYEIKNRLDYFEQQIDSFRGSLDLEGLEADIADYDHQMSQPGFWDDNEAAQVVIKKSNEAKQAYDSLNNLITQVEELAMAVELYELSQDPELLAEAESLTSQVEELINNYALEMLLSGEHDESDAILEIHPGAGGTESQDWGSILLRMYQRWADHKGYQVAVIDYQAGEEAGIKSVTLEIRGRNAYGYLKSEKGVHRLVRISPFDSNSRRHTSFASVEVVPVLDDTIEVVINDDDLRIDTYRASGAGGQHVNKTDSAVRITHLPTGIVTQSQSQRSQLQNREQAMALLKAKLYQKQEEDKQAELDQIKGNQKEIAWGSQIRSYVFHPYSMVKDHRTNYEVGNADAVVDGELDGFIDAYLKWAMNLNEEG